MPNIDEAIEALLAYQQADMEGVMVLASRQAIHEVADELRRLRRLAQEAKDTLEVRQHIAWLFQYVQGMNERNWHDMKLRAERQLEQLSLAFPGPSDTSSVQPQTDWNYAPKPGQLSGPSSKD